MKTAVILWSLLQPHVDDPAMWHQVGVFATDADCQQEATADNGILRRGEEIYVCQPNDWRPRRRGNDE